MEPVTRPKRCVGSNLEHVTRASPRQQHAAGRNQNELEHPQVGVEERHPDLEPHADGVHRTRSLEEESRARGQVVPAEEPSGPLTAGDGDLDPQSNPVPAHQGLPHASTIATPSDAGRPVLTLAAEPYRSCGEPGGGPGSTSTGSATGTTGVIERAGTCSAPTR